MTEEFIGCIEEELKEIELFYEENEVGRSGSIYFT